MSASPDEALATIPGWDGAAWRELPGGLTNRTLQVEKDGRRAVLKIDPAPRKSPFNSRQEETRIQQRAATSPTTRTSCVSAGRYATYTGSP